MLDHNLQAIEEAPWKEEQEKSIMDEKATKALIN